MVPTKILRTTDDKEVAVDSDPGVGEGTLSRREI